MKTPLFMPNLYSYIRACYLQGEPEVLYRSIDRTAKKCYTFNTLSWLKSDFSHFLPYGFGFLQHKKCFFEFGAVAEWLIATVLKTVSPSRVTGVRIPPAPLCHLVTSDLFECLILPLVKTYRCSPAHILYHLLMYLSYQMMTLCCYQSKQFFVSWFVSDCVGLCS